MSLSGWPFEQIAELQTLAKHVETLVAAELLGLGWMLAPVHPAGERAALKAVPTKIPAPEPSVCRSAFHNLGDSPRGDRLGAKPGQGRGFPPVGLSPASSAEPCRPPRSRATLDSQMRRNTGPAVMPPPSSQVSRARTGHSSVWQGSGAVTVSVCDPLVGQSETQPTLGLLELFNADRRKRGAR